MVKNISCMASYDAGLLQNIGGNESDAGHQIIKFDLFGVAMRVSARRHSISQVQAKTLAQGSESQLSDTWY
jgi:hypothetical protein